MSLKLASYIGYKSKSRLKCVKTLSKTTFPTLLNAYIITVIPIKSMFFFLITHKNDSD